MDDEQQYGAQAFAALRTQDTPPLDVDIDRAVSAGRARVRTRRAFAAGAGVVVVTGVVAATRAFGGGVGPGLAAGALGAGPAVASCRVERLPAPPGKAQRVDVTAVDPVGRYVVGAVPGSEEGGPSGSALRWDGDRVTDLGVTGLSPTPKAVNAAGVVVGGTTRNHGLVAWVYRDGAARDLPGLAGQGMVANGINDRGDIVGVAYGAHDVTTAVLWPAAQPETVRVLTAAGSAEATAISATGVVVGAVGDRPYVWDAAGVGRQLPAPAGPQRGAVNGIAGDWVYGWSGVIEGATASGPGPAASSAPSTGATSTTPTHPGWLRWNISDGRMDPLSTVEPEAITAGGMVVGVTPASAGSKPFHDAAVLRDGAVLTLPHLDAERTFSDATGVSADGRTIVGVESADSATTPVIWHC